LTASTASFLDTATSYPGLSTVAFLLTALLSVVVHFVLGWEWTILVGGVGGGISRSYPGWVVGAVGVGTGWAALVIYTAWGSSASFRILLDSLSSLAGNIPGEALVGLTVLLGTLLGALGGGMGSLLRQLVREPGR